MNVKLTTDVPAIEIPYEVMVHAVNCHSLQLTKWEKEVKEEFIKKINLPDISREEAERNLVWLYDDLDKIAVHRKSNDELKEALKQVLLSKVTTIKNDGETSKTDAELDTLIASAMPFMGGIT